VFLNKPPCRRSLAKRFPLDLPQIESAVPLHKAYDRIELAVYEAAVVADDGYAYNSAHLAVIMVNFRDGDIESAFEPADKTLDDTPLSL
jgi:hypothetical protein